MSHEITEKFIVSLGTITLRVIVLVLVFAARTGFPFKHSIVNVLKMKRKLYD